VNGTTRVTYTGRPGTTKEAELSALVNVYSFLINSRQGKDGAAGRNGSNNDEKQERR
jgi:hypothetical protein